MPYQIPRVGTIVHNGTERAFEGVQYVSHGSKFIVARLIPNDTTTAIDFPVDQWTFHPDVEPIVLPLGYAAVVRWTRHGHRRTMARINGNGWRGIAGLQGTSLEPDSELIERIQKELDPGSFEVLYKGVLPQ